MDSKSQIISHIIDLKRKEIVHKSLTTSTRELEEKVLKRGEFRGFHNVVNSCIEQHELCVIGDILRSGYCCEEPSEHFDAVKQAKAFIEEGVHAISVATDENFYHGKDEDLKQVSKVAKVPVLRKEFIIDAYQVLETAIYDADCIILKAACLERNALLELSKLAKDIGLDVIVEVHTLSDLDKLIDLPVRMVSINNLDMNTNEIDLSTSMNLVGQLPEDYLVFSENGITSEADVEILLAGGIHGFFINSCQNNDTPKNVFSKLFPNSHR